MRHTPARHLRLALAQCSPMPGDVAANARLAGDLLRRAADQGARLLAFPELFLTGYELALLEREPGAWLTPGDARLDPVRAACADTGVTAILGGPLREAGRRSIAAPVIGPAGDVGVSHKVHVHHSERGLFEPGEALAPFSVDGWAVAVGICFDAAFPSHAALAAAQGAHLYIGSALYMAGEERRCDLHFGARAMDNRMFSALANYAGETGGFRSIGASGVWGPSGDVVRRLVGDGEELMVVDLDPGAVLAYA